MIWKAKAACRDMDPGYFFPESTTFMPAEVAAACARCVVREQCLDAGLRERDGIWGGLTSEQRRRIARRHHRRSVA